MKSFIKAAFLATAMFFAVPLAHADGQKCPGSATQREFLDLAVTRKTPIFTLKPEAQTKFIAFFNSSGEIKLSPSAQLFVGNIGGGQVGLVVFDKGCVVLGTVTQLPAKAFLIFVQGAGLSDSDIIPYDAGLPA